MHVYQKPNEGVGKFSAAAAKDRFVKRKLGGSQKSSGSGPFVGREVPKFGISDATKQQIKTRVDDASLMRQFNDIKDFKHATAGPVRESA